jgi:hypothetical protein
MTDNWRDLGDTTLEQFVAEFEEYDSPLLAEAPAIYAAVKGHSKLALAKLWKEQKHGTWNQAIPRDYKNPFSQTRPGASSNDGVNRWQRFSTYEQAAAYWKDRVTSPTGPYKDTVTLEDLVHVYAPDYDNNNEKEYVRQLGWPRCRIARSHRPCANSRPSRWSAARIPSSSRRRWSS